MSYCCGCRHAVKARGCSSVPPLRSFTPKRTVPTGAEALKQTKAIFRFISSFGSISNVRRTPSSSNAIPGTCGALHHRFSRPTQLLKGFEQCFAEHVHRHYESECLMLDKLLDAKRWF